MRYSITAFYPASLLAANKNNRMSQGQQVKAEMQAKYLILVRWQVKEG
jgi:hypothetical protein